VATVATPAACDTDTHTRAADGVGDTNADANDNLRRSGPPAAAAAQTLAVAARVAGPRRPRATAARPTIARAASAGRPERRPCQTTLHRRRPPPSAGPLHRDPAKGFARAHHPAETNYFKRECK
jgi:hypothetical protein